MLSSIMISLTGFSHTMMGGTKLYRRQEMAPSSNAFGSALPTPSMVGKALHKNPDRKRTTEGTTRRTTR